MSRALFPTTFLCSWLYKREPGTHKNSQKVKAQFYLSVLVVNGILPTTNMNIRQIKEEKCNIYRSIAKGHIFFINTYNNELRHLLTAKVSESHFILCLPLHTPRFKLSWAKDSHSFKLSISFLKSSSWTLQPRRDRLRMLLSLRESQISLISSALSSSLQIWSVPKSIFVVQMGGNIYLEQRLSGKILWQSCPSPIAIVTKAICETTSVRRYWLEPTKIWALVQSTSGFIIA